MYFDPEYRIICLGLRKISRREDNYISLILLTIFPIKLPTLGGLNINRFIGVQLSKFSRNFMKNKNLAI